MIDWTYEMARFRPLVDDSVVKRRTRQLSAAAVRAVRYAGTERGQRYSEGIGKRFAELVATTAVRFDLVADMRTVSDLLWNFTFGEKPVTVMPQRIPNAEKKD